jgi:hypothetical protein
MTNSNDPQTDKELREMLESVRRRLRKLTIAVFLLTLAVLLCSAAIYGDLANYFGGDRALQGGIATLAAVLGFVFGWFAGRKA